MTSKLYEALKITANEINDKNKEYGFYALRKVNALNENSPMKSLIQCGNDLVLIAKKIEETI